ncbi:unnamed protein product [Brachionus calyciflorus]|uniref:Reverse transcriptase domain-containing protein n=1 Tax=Brachionus calyciflorus TaxID=104777 RepID=A0A814MBP8_9BILA|nr:unnamed protein product [Brachionus calyciflorus]
MSPKLFSIFIDDLIIVIQKLPVGLELGNGNKLDLIVYTDNILIIITTKLGLKTQLNAIELYGRANEIKYNPEKTYLIVFNKNVTRGVARKRNDI